MYSKILLFVLLRSVVCEDSDAEAESKRLNPCICVPSFQCKDGEIITDGANLLDPRKESAEAKHGSCQPPKVCCRPPGSKPHQEDKCGIRGQPKGLDSRIMSEGQDSDTEPAEFPWQGAILQPADGSLLFKCGCVLISQWYAITAAHCVPECKKKPSTYVMLFGVWDTKESKTDSSQEVQIMNCTIHPEYEKETLKNDIAVIGIKAPGVKFASNVQRVCLPFKNETHIGDKCIVTGWGKDSWEEGKFSSVLKMVTVPIQSQERCRDMLSKTRLGQFYEFHSSFLCAGGNEGQDACKGDGGGPLVCSRKDDTYAVVGLVSWGISCGMKGVPGVYVQVTHFLNWIESVTKQDIGTYWPSKHG